MENFFLAKIGEQDTKKNILNQFLLLTVTFISNLFALTFSRVFDLDKQRHRETEKLNLNKTFKNAQILSMSVIKVLNINFNALCVLIF